jgi:hypothetical protein
MVDDREALALNSLARRASAMAKPTALATPMPKGRSWFNAHGMAPFGMAGALRADLAELLSSSMGRP